MPTEDTGRLSLADARGMFNSCEIGPALFSASCGNLADAGARVAGPKVHIYPLKDEGPGFAWLIWHGPLDYDDIGKAIKRGGFLANATLDQAAHVAVGELLTFDRGE